MFKKSWRVRQMVQELRSLTALAKDLSLVPSIRIGQLTTICNCSFMGSDTSVSSGTCAHMHILTTHNLK